MNRSFVLAALLLFTAAGTAAVSGPPAVASGTPDEVLLGPGDLHWMPAPAVFPAGAKIAVLRGNPFAEGFFTVRLWLPAHYAIPPHWHPTTESFTVLKGTLYVGMGSKLDRSQAKPVPTLGYASLPPLHPHYVYTTDEEVVIDLSAYGPFQITYVNPADNPAAKSATGH